MIGKACPGFPVAGNALSSAADCPSPVPDLSDLSSASDHSLTSLTAQTFLYPGDQPPPPLLTSLTSDCRVCCAGAMPWPGGGVSRSLPGWVATLASTSLTSTLILSLVLGLTSSLGEHQTRPAASPWPSPEAGTRGQLAQSVAGGGARTDSEAGGDHGPGQPLSGLPHTDEASDGAAWRSARSPPSNHSLLLSHSLTQCLPSLLSDSAAVTAGQICRCADTWTRVWLTLHNPNPVFTSQCWDRTPHHRDYCLPPVLTPSELANIESPVSGVCEAQVESLLSRVRAHTSLMEESMKVLQSAGSSAQCHNASHCQACAVSHNIPRLPDKQSQMKERN